MIGLGEGLIQFFGHMRLRQVCIARWVFKTDQQAFNEGFNGIGACLEVLSLLIFESCQGRQKETNDLSLPLY